MDSCLIWVSAGEAEKPGERRKVEESPRKMSEQILAKVLFMVSLLGLPLVYE
jgi:hypothetical protein